MRINPNGSVTRNRGAQHKRPGRRARLDRQVRALSRLMESSRTLRGEKEIAILRQKLGSA